MRYAEVAFFIYVKSLYLADFIAKRAANIICFALKRGLTLLRGKIEKILGASESASGAAFPYFGPVLAPFDIIDSLRLKFYDPITKRSVRRLFDDAEWMCLWRRNGNDGIAVGTRGEALEHFANCFRPCEGISGRAERQQIGIPFFVFLEPA